jgi:hypothetical protein
VQTHLEHYCQGGLFSEKAASTSKLKVTQLQNLKYKKTVEMQKGRRAKKGESFNP